MRTLSLTLSLALAAFTGCASDTPPATTPAPEVVYDAPEEEVIEENSETDGLPYVSMLREGDPVFFTNERGGTMFYYLVPMTSGWSGDDFLYGDGLGGGYDWEVGIRTDTDTTNQYEYNRVMLPSYGEVLCLAIGSIDAPTSDNYRHWWSLAEWSNDPALVAGGFLAIKGGTTTEPIVELAIQLTADGNVIGAASLCEARDE